MLGFQPSGERSNRSTRTKKLEFVMDYAENLEWIKNEIFRRKWDPHNVAIWPTSIAESRYIDSLMVGAQVGERARIYAFANKRMLEQTILATGATGVERGWGKYGDNNYSSQKVDYMKAIHDIIGR
jgi:hypothetical protein